MIEKMDMKSMDITEENVKKIQALFPNAVTEVIVDGKTTLKIDFDVLKQELSESLIEDKQERYQMTWPDKSKAKVLANSRITSTLRPDKEKSVDFDNTQNLYIEGDNLDVLKLLRETYLGKVKMIYIDPPYNTGNDFVYNDDFAMQSEEWSEKSGDYDEEGNRLVKNLESNGRFHTDWLNMIYPRLKVAKDLLSDDGVIFISIDDNEVENLKAVCNEIFGKQNSTFPFIWALPRGINAGLVARAHEYVLCYVKNINSISSFNRPTAEVEYSIERCNKKIDARHPESTISFPAGIPYEGEDKVIEGVIEGSEKITIYGKMIFKDGKLAEPVTLSAGWTMKNMILDWLNGKKVFDLKGQPIEGFFFKENGRLYSKKRVTTLSIKSILKDMPDTQDARKEMAALFNNEDIFSYPKTIDLPKLLSALTTNKDSLILDFFSGSATTAHAVMQLNAEDGGNRKFIMVQLPEECDEKSEAYKAGYKTICEIGEERIRRAGKKILDEFSGNRGKDLGDSENNPLTPNPQSLTPKIDTGFRVLKLDSSNMQDVYYNPQAMRQSLLDETIDNVKLDRTPLDLLFQVMLDLGVELSAKIEERQVNGKTYYVVNGNDLIACFDEDIDNSVITEIAKQQPLYAVFKSTSFATDSASINNEQLFNTYSPATVIKVI